MKIKQLKRAKNSDLDDLDLDLNDLASNLCAVLLLFKQWHIHASYISRSWEENHKLSHWPTCNSASPKHGERRGDAKQRLCYNKISLNSKIQENQRRRRMESGKPSSFTRKYQAFGGANRFSCIHQETLSKRFATSWQNPHHSLVTGVFGGDVSRLNPRKNTSLLIGHKNVEITTKCNEIPKCSSTLFLALSRSLAHRIDGGFEGNNYVS